MRDGTENKGGGGLGLDMDSMCVSVGRSKSRITI